MQWLENIIGLHVLIWENIQEIYEKKYAGEQCLLVYQLNVLFEVTHVHIHMFYRHIKLLEKFTRNFNSSYHW